MVARNFSMYSTSDLGITAGNYVGGANLTSTGTFTTSATVKPTYVTLDDTDSQNNLYNDGIPGNFGGAPVNQQLTGTVDGTTFTNTPSNPENEYEVRDSNNVVVGLLYDLHNSNSGAFGTLQGFVTTFKFDPSETYSVTRVSSLVSAVYTTFITCFASDTLILSEHGNVPIQTLKVGDKVVTMDHGLQSIRWIGSRTVQATNEYAPICFSKDALGNTRKLHVSPNHRMLISDWRAEMLFGQKQVLVAAKDLVNGDTIFRDPIDSISYFHILFDQHEVIYAEDAPSESFLPSNMSLAAQDEATQEEILKLFPELLEDTSYEVEAARPSLRSFEGACLSALLNQ